MYMGFQYPSYPVQRQQYQVQQAAHLIGRQVKVNRGGPDSVQGVLLAIPSDYLVVLSDNTIVYVNGTHVKSITEGAAGTDRSNGRSGGGKSGGGRSRGGHSGGSRSRVTPNFIRASSFQSLLSRLRHEHVQINRGGPEKLDGFLAEISSDNVLLIVDRELVRIPTFHIKNVSVSSKNNNKNNNKKNDNKNGSGGNNQSDGGRSRGGRSDGRTDGRTDGRRTSGRTGGRRTGGRTDGKRSDARRSDGRRRNGGRGTGGGRSRRWG